MLKYLLDRGDVVGALFLDLKKEYEAINHEILLTKLSGFHFSP